MEISNYLEKIRYGRKISQEDFVDGVVSLRQYQRYRSGECEITYEKIEQFANKLGIPSKKLMHEFERESSLQYKQINDFYNAVVNKDLHKAQDIKQILEKDFILNEDRKLYFQHALIMYDYFMGRKSKDETMYLTAQLINYPLVLKQNFFTDIEVLILSFMLSIVEKDQQKKLLKKLTSLFDTGENIMSGDNDAIYSLILMRLCKLHGVQKNYAKVVDLCEKGIQRGTTYEYYYMLEYFFYYKALSHFKLEEYDSYEEALFRCYNVLHMDGNRKKIEKFTKLIEKDFDINFDMFMMKYLKKNIL